MAENMFQLKIISPEALFYEGEADFLEFTSTDGEMGVYKNHIPTTTILDTHVMKIYSGDEMRKVAVFGGFIEILQDSITVLAEGCEWPENIDEDRAKQARKRAQDRLARKDGSIDVARAEAALKRAMTRLGALK